MGGKRLLAKKIITRQKKIDHRGYVKIVVYMGCVFGHISLLTDKLIRV